MNITKNKTTELHERKVITVMRKNMFALNRRYDEFSLSFVCISNVSLLKPNYPIQLSLQMDCGHPFWDETKAHISLSL